MFDSLLQVGKVVDGAPAIGHLHCDFFTLLSPSRWQEIRFFFPVQHILLPPPYPQIPAKVADMPSSAEQPPSKKRKLSPELENHDPTTTTKATTAAPSTTDKLQDTTPPDDTNLVHGPNNEQSDTQSRREAFECLIDFYNEGDLHDDDKDNTRRTYSLPPPPGSAPTEELLWEAFLAKVEEADDQLIEHIRCHREQRIQMTVLEEQRQRDQRRMGELAVRNGELITQLREQGDRDGKRIEELEEGIREEKKEREGDWKWIKELEGQYMRDRRRIGELEAEVRELRARGRKRGKLRVFLPRVGSGGTVEIEPEEGGVVVVDKGVVEVLRRAFGMDK
ncbi:hypothetical protein QC762_403175 [Podospora pseudocomata]|uniref:Uncharacterized protein n=1 Tax=Podospora pseudocomata TaxID=2093779 RepID=A0ABR0GFP9_9PEZI|nr:hypothetical protein QC762_403175 [Podospora pseudocomata]